MIELCIVMLGLIMLISLSYRIVLEASALNLNYHFITINNQCEVLCILKKHIP